MVNISINPIAWSIDSLFSFSKIVKMWPRTINRPKVTMIPSKLDLLYQGFREQNLQSPTGFQALHFMAVQSLL